jgi:hypothetical protein
MELVIKAVFVIIGVAAEAFFLYVIVGMLQALRRGH